MKQTVNLYDLISSLYQKEVSDYNDYMSDNPDDEQRTRDHILISSVYGKILHAIKEVI